MTVREDWSTGDHFDASDQNEIGAAVNDVVASDAAKQPLDSDLTAFAGKTAPSGAVVGTTDSQTLTNKTLTSPVVNTPTGIVKGDVGLGNVDNTSDATKNSATATLTNKAITRRFNTTTSSATPAINTDTTDVFTITAQAANITSMTTNLTGTQVDGQLLDVRIKGTGARTIAWGAKFISSGSQTLLATTATTKTHLNRFVYDSTSAAFVCYYVDATGY